MNAYRIRISTSIRLVPVIVIVGFMIAGNWATPASASDTAVADIDRLPLAFVENCGQWPNETRFIVRQRGMVSRLEDDRVILTLAGSSADDTVRNVEVQLVFEGACKDVVLEGESRQRGKHNFFLGSDRSAWRTGVPAFSSVLYRDLCDGMDLRLRDGGGILEYDLLVEPGADCGLFVVRCEGIEGFEIDEDGWLVFETALGTLRQKPPVAWQAYADGERTPVECCFRKVDDTRYSFDIPEIDSNQALVVDPGLLWSTYLGDVRDDNCNAVAVDSNGLVYIAGSTASDLFPTTNGAYDESHNGFKDIWIAKMDPSKSGADQMVWSTFLGGSDDDGCNNIALDSTGAVTVVGATDSSDIPVTTGAFDTSYNGNKDSYAARIDSSGSVLLWATYIGGSAEDRSGGLRTMHMTTDGIVTLTGRTESTDFPTTTGAFQATNAGDVDMFVACFDPAQSGNAQLLYATYFGGSDFDRGNGIAVDSTGCVAVGGWTYSSDLETTPGAFDTSYNGGTGDAYFVLLDPSKSGTDQLLYSTFYGGTGDEWVNSLAMDAQGLVIITGGTESSNLPTTPGAFDEGFNGGVEDCYAAWFDPKGNGVADLVYATFVGDSTGYDNGFDVVIDDAGVATIAGITNSVDFPTTPGAFNRTRNGGQDVFVIRLFPGMEGTRDLRYGTYLGGGLAELPWGLALDNIGQPVVGGYTKSSDFPTTEGAYDRTKSGLSVYRDAYVSQLSVIMTDITVNGMDGPLVINQGDNLIVEIEIAPECSLGQDADWWLIASSPFGWYRYHLTSGTWTLGFAATHQGPLVDVGPMTIYNGTSLPVGTYTFYFGVDTNRNGVFDEPDSTYDSAEVTVQ